MGHTYSDLLIHAVFGTKDRRPFLAPEIRPRLYEYLAGIARQEIGHALRIGGTEDHVHGLLRLRTEISPGVAMQKWKALSSGWVHRTFPGARDFAWQAGYGAFSVSHSNAPKVIAYIDSQERHHRKRTFEEEFLELLHRHQITYDPLHVWE